MDQYVHAANKVVQNQKQFKSDAPVYLLGKYDKFVMKGVWAGVSAGVVLIGVSMWRMMTNTGKIERS